MKSLIAFVFALAVLCGNARAQSPVFGPAFGNTITSPDSSLTVGGTNTATQVTLNTAHANAFTAFQSFNNGFGSGPGSSLWSANPGTSYFFVGGQFYASGTMASNIGNYGGDARFVATTLSAMAGLWTDSYAGTGSGGQMVIGSPFTAGLGLTDSATQDTLITTKTGKAIRLGVAGSASMVQITSANVTIPSIKATTGTRYVCVDASGNITSSATACSGT